MEKELAAILQDLYEIDPALQTKEGELINIIEKLRSARPHAEMDETFKAELKAKLLAGLANRKTGNRNPAVKKIIGYASLAASVLVITATVLFFTGILRPARLSRTGRQDLKTVQAEQSIALLREKQDKDRGAADPQPAAPGEINAPRLAERETMNKISLNSQFAGTEITNTPMADGYSAGGQDSTENGRLLPADTYNTEEYDRIYENRFLDVTGNPLSTFSIDVDTASYANVRRYIRSHRLPPPDAVRIEELINYFDYDYPDAAGEEVFAFATETAACPWDSSHWLLQIGIQGKKIDTSQLPPANLVFLIDVSGSMEDPEKLPLLRKAFLLLAANLRDQDRVAIVVYAGAAGLVLNATPGSDRQTIAGAIENLQAGGSTAGGAGIQLAYKVAADNFIRNGNNRIILATDGDFNVGPSSDAELIRLIEQKRGQGIFLTILGFGMGNYKDSKMEQLADKGNGNYSYIDNILEAKKVLVTEMGGTLLTIAKDVKIQIEFNPAWVKSYRLIGYENRLLAAEDFSDDSKDAGELGAGHTVTALYELIPADGAAGGSSLKYQQTIVRKEAAGSGELLTLKFRYKQPAGETSRLQEVPVTAGILPLHAASANFRFAAAVAEWGLLLRDSSFKGESSFDQVLELAAAASGYDRFGYREEFRALVRESAVLQQVE